MALCNLLCNDPLFLPFWWLKSSLHFEEMIFPLVYYLLLDGVVAEFPFYYGLMNARGFVSPYVLKYGR